MAEWETVGKQNDGWETVDEWETVSPNKRKTTVLEDLQIGLNTAAAPVVKAAGLLGGGVASAFGATDTADSIYKGMEEKLKSMEDYWTPKDAQQDFTGKAIGTVGTIPMQLLSFPFSPYDTGKEMLDSGESLEKARQAAGIDTTMNVAGAALPGAIGGNLFKKFVSGAAINAGQEAATKQAISSLAETKEAKEKFAPTLEGAALAGIVGGPMGVLSPSKPRKANEPKPIEKPDTQNPTVEQELLKQGYASAQKDYAQHLELYNKFKDAVDNGDVSKETISALQEIEIGLQKYQEEIKNYESILGGKQETADQKTAEGINKTREQLDRLEAMRAQQRPGNGPRELAPDEVAPFPDRVPPGWEEKIDTETGEVTTTQPKITPIEVALTRIGEAMDNPPLAAKRMQEAQERLDNLVDRQGREDTPGSSYSALRSALEVELKAYSEIVSGKSPDLSAMEKATQQTPEPTVDRASLIAEARAKSQANLEQQQAASGLMPPDPLNQGAPRADQSGLVRQAPRPEQVGEASGWVPRMDEVVGYHPKGRRTVADLEINKIDKQLEALSQQETNAPIGTFDAANAQARREMLEAQKARWESIRQYAVEQMQAQGMQDTLAKTEQETKEANELAVAPEKFADVSTVLDTTKDAQGNLTSKTVSAFDNNQQLFNKVPDKKVYFDKTISNQFGPKLEKIITHLLNVTRFGNEKVYFINSENLGALAQAEFVGNTTIIKFNPQKIQANLDRVVSSSLFKNIVGEGRIAETIRDYNMTRFAAHELGHALFTKYLRDKVTHVDDLTKLSDDWQRYNKTNKLQTVSSMDIGANKKRIDYQKNFTEFFSERVARELMLKNILGAFDNRSKKYLADIHKILDVSSKYLQKLGVDLNKKDFADTILNDILNDSNNYIKQMGAEAEHRVSILGNDRLIFGHKAADPDAFPFHKMTLEGAIEAHYKMQQPDMYPDSGAHPAAAMKDLDVVSPLSWRSAVALGHGFSRNFFGKIGVAKVFRDNPRIQQVYQSIRQAERYANDVNNRLWHGMVQKGVWEGKNFVQRMSKVVLESSAYHQVKNASDDDLAIVHDLFKKGFEDNLEYNDNYNLNGQHLNASQKKLYDTLASLFENQYAEVVHLEQTLGKKNIMQKRPGWYPSVRAGQYFVDVSYNGRTLHREHFRSKVEADHFRKNMKDVGYNNVIVSDAQHMKDTQQMSDMYGGLDLAQRILAQKFPNAAPAIQQTIQQALNNIITKGGKLGGHHQFRSNLPGYRGTELFYNKQEKGNSFRAAIQQSVNDYSGGLRKMMIQHETDPLLKNSGLDPNAPETQTMQMMIDSSLGRVQPNAFEKVDRTIIEVWDGMMKKLSKEIKPNQAGSFEQWHGHALEFFYLTKLMAKLTFPISQILGAAGSIRELSYSGGYVKPYIGMGKALAKLITGNKELKEVLYDVSQKSNTLEPQFMEALHMSPDNSKFLDIFKDWALLRKPNEVADTLSRTITFSAAYEMYRSMGMGKDTAIDKAMADTDSTMVAYGKTETAPIFNRMGIVGQVVKPLQTFGQQSFANFISDFKYMKANNPNTWAPMLNYMMVTGILGGALSPILVQEYELFRKMMEKFFPEHAPPAIIELAKHTPDFLDKMGIDPDMVAKAELYGIPAALSGVDLASSMRANQTFLTLLGSIITGEESWGQLLPHLNTLAGVASGTATMAAGAITGNKTPAEMRTALTTALPSGAIGYGAKEVAGLNTTSVFGQDKDMVAGGKENAAMVKRGPTELLAGFMGTKSTEEKYQGDISRYLSEKQKINKEKINKQYDLLLATSPNSPQMEERLKKLVDLGETSESIENNIGSEAFKRVVPIVTRLYMDKTGNVPNNLKNAKTLSELGQFRRY